MEERAFSLCVHSVREIRTNNAEQREWEVRADAEDAFGLPVSLFYRTPDASTLPKVDSILEVTVTPR